MKPLASQLEWIEEFVLRIKPFVFVRLRDNVLIRMPNEANFVPDPRPDVSNTRCMQNCRDPQQIQILLLIA